jgi:TrmH family RNA methyltransferase
VLRSRDNPRVRRWRRLQRDARLRRTERRALLEGAHLLAALLERGGVPLALIATEASLEDAEIAALVRRTGIAPVFLSERVFRSVSDTETPTGLAAEIEIRCDEIDPAASPGCAFLEGVQDAGNVGAILRSAAAFGVADVVLDGKCADPWSPKVLRAAMGAHFGLRIAQHPDLAEAVARFAGTTVCAVPATGVVLASIDLRGRVGWIFGAEGRGVSAALAMRATLRASIPMAPGAESLNVGAAAAICFYEQARQRAGAAPSTPGARS